MLIILSAEITFLIVYLVKETLVSLYVASYIASHLQLDNQLVHLAIVAPVIEELLKRLGYGFTFIPSIQKFLNILERQGKKHNDLFGKLLKKNPKTMVRWRKDS